MLLRAMEGRLGAAYSAVYVDILVDCASGHVVGQTAHFLVALLEKVRGALHTLCTLCAGPVAGAKGCHLLAQ